MSVKILTDSACDLPKDLIEEYDIDVIPLVVIDDDKEYLDNVSIKPKVLYDNMRGGQVYKTAQVPLKVFENKFEDIANKGESVIYISFSSGLSATYQASIIAKNSIKEKYPNFDIDIVDSKSASLGFGLLVYKAARMAKEGKNKDEILSMLEFYIRNIEHIFTVDDIEYLFRGGRVSRTQAFVGGLLNIKPILDVSVEGKLQPLEKLRGKSKVLKRMLEIMDDRAKEADLNAQTIGISHGDNLDNALRLKKMIEEKYGCIDFIINEIGCAIGAHSGPGTIALFFLDKNYED
ncbi:DegV family protein [Schnuerera sp. xch1]|uniref:DegV family protein n=1 Tax=Schnuerera sp. xch1 TaxID=2874283 RepID=UPI001CBCFE2E|nr:DegV family protein [Schnuerera sp. xch1]MBZ2174232.1 DegV family protein [Schnuerera sp. xch1]